MEFGKCRKEFGAKASNNNPKIEWSCRKRTVLKKMANQ
jgi:hypothetical protein